MSSPYWLYGVPASYYTGKARAYLRKQHVDFEERSSAHPAYGTEIFPKTRRIILPVLQTPDGDVIQDSDAIIEYFETAGLARQSAHPAGPRQRVLSEVFNLLGSEGLVRLAMHYRWSVLDQHDSFIAAGFAAGIAPEAPPSQAAEISRPMMQRLAGYLPSLGVTPDTISAIEASWHELLDILQAHFLVHPYLFGGQPSLGDYGMYSALFAHLGRDPVPAFQMKLRAERVFRWTERMSAPNLDMPEYPGHAPGFLPDDAIPPTLAALCQFLVDDMLPELTDQVAGYNAFLDAHPVETGDPVVAKPHRRSLASIETSYRGHPVTGAVPPYRIYMLQKITDALAAVPEAERPAVRATLDGLGLAPLLDLKPKRRVERRDNLEVWGKLNPV
tara:strand:- start:12072 stop:13232 length:1161 start_codon:yes stop_codon:yes gene_type:complete